MTGADDEMFNTVQRYKILAENKENQAAMIKDSAVVQFLVYVLEGTSIAVRDTAMSTLELLGENIKLRPTLRKTFGVMESLEAIASSSAPEEVNLAERARKLHSKLEQSNNVVWEVPKEVLLRIPELSSEDCTEIWQALSSVRGVVSCQFNLELQTCTLTVFSSMNPQSLVQILSNQCSLDAEVVKPGSQVSSQDSVPDLPAYLPEEDSPVVQKKAVARRRPKRRESSWFTRAASVIVDSFFW
ncbi:armadillo repeat-containing protein 1-like [Frankliniella occidentalis]|uniref:Armadillo repeat-containing protein 1-like n=1 Tax=Frankliniella occidentalis TaxID=133901 RepID=A0A6J1SZE5_FRAOC|nr:armadillo repeat-containing protein 1-like [Frankliniella occidentalis]